MKRLTALTVAALALGCEHNQHSSTEQPKQTMASPATAQPAGASAKPSAAPSAKEYYEVTRNGKTYVFSNLDAMVAFRSTGALPADMTEKTAFGPKGETVVFQTTNGAEPGLAAEYAKAHPKK